MLSLALGLAAAICWGLHDFCVRFVSQRSDSLTVFLVVLGCGALLLAPVTLFAGGWKAVTLHGAGYAALSGLAYVLGGIGLYRAFSIGPVRLVAPIAGSFPVLSVSWAALQGQPVTPGQWLAVFGVLAGVGLVAASDQTDGDRSDNSRRGKAALWALAASAGFALTFALGHIAAEHAPDLPVVMIARLVTMAGMAGVLLLRGHPITLDRTHLPLIAVMGGLDVLALACVIAAGGTSHPEYAAVASSIFGVITIILCWRFLGERMTAVQWAGVALVFAAIGWLAR
jgi:drug/metabolite transporter (DMT)-like permease